jgi:toxin ParE1/3/4
MKIVRHPDVLEELISLSYHIALDNEAAANRFLDACDEAFQQIALTPQIGASRQFHHPALRDVRMWRIKGFEKYLIFYRPLADAVEILHVVHSARDLTALFDDPEQLDRE